MTRPADFDATRAAVASRGLVASASAALTDVAMRLPFEDLGAFKTLLKRLFSPEPWTAADDDALSGLVRPHVAEGWWEIPLDGDIVLSHGAADGRYVVWVTGAGDGPARPGLFDRVFSGPVKPEATPHPRKVKFQLGGPRAPGRWYTRTDEAPPDDARAAVLLADPDVTDVMVAGDFVTIGLGRGASWEDRLDGMLETVAALFPAGDSSEGDERTRDELLQEGRATRVEAARALHLLDPDDPPSRARLLEALDASDARLRRIAVAVLAESEDTAVAHGALRQGYADNSRVVRRTAIDTAADAEDESLRDLFEQALADEDAWTRWKAVRSLGELGTGSSHGAVEPLTHDVDFQVRFEVARVLRDVRETEDELTEARRPAIESIEE